MEDNASLEAEDIRSQLRQCYLLTATRMEKEIQLFPTRVVSATTSQTLTSLCVMFLLPAADS